MLANLAVASDVVVESIVNPSVAFDVALVVWSTITIALMGLTAIAVFFAKSWKHRVDKVTEKNAIEIDTLKNTYTGCALTMAEKYTDKDMFIKQVEACSVLQRRIFDKIDSMHKDLADTRVKLVESEARIIKEIKNGNK